MTTSRILPLALLALTAWTEAPAQRATEVYIPIGESPGISASESVIGSISSIDYAQYHMTITTPVESITVMLTNRTLYYIDNSNQKMRSVTGGIEDCEVGSRVEALVNDDGEAVWVKVQAPG